MKRKIGFFIILIIVVLLISGCNSRKEGEYLDSGFDSNTGRFESVDDGYFKVEERVDRNHYIVSNPSGDKYYASRVENDLYVIGGEYHE